jgi:hypothetical protein
VTPNFALGANCALESAVVLVNKLVGLDRTISENNRPDAETLTKLFNEYQAERKPRMIEAFEASHLMTRLQAYDGLINHFTMRVMVPLLGQSTFADKLAELVSGAPKFDFLPVKYPSVATTYQWKDEIQAEVARGSGKSAGKVQDSGPKHPHVAFWTLQVVAFLTLFWMFIVRGAPGQPLPLDQAQQLGLPSLEVNASQRHVQAGLEL